MRILLKILLFPITLALSVIVLVCEFLCVFSTMLLSVLALLLFVLALAIMVLIGEVGEGLKHYSLPTSSAHTECRCSPLGSLVR